MEKLKKGRLLLVSNFGTVIIRDDDLRISAIGHDQYMRERMNAPAGTPPPKWKTNEEWYREAERIASKIWPGYRLVRIKVGNIGDDYVPELRSGSNVRNTVYVQFWAKTNRVTRALGMSFDRGSGRFYEGLLQDPPPTSSPTRKPLPPRKDN